MSIIDTLVTDRTQADVDRVLAFVKRGWENLTDAEKAAWDAGMKGAYNAADLNRVNAAAEYLAARFLAAGYSLPGYLPGKSDWTEDDFPTAAQMRRYLDNIETLRSRVPVTETTPETPESMERLTVSGANDIEQILRDADSLLTRSQQVAYYSGEVFAGEI